MNIEYFNEPSPHYVIDNFLTKRIAKLILKECIELQQSYEQAVITNDKTENIDPEHCEDCKANQNLYRNGMRDNKVVYLDLHYKHRKRSASLLYLEQAVTEFGFMEFIKHSEGVFPYLNHTNTSESLVSRYGKCDFYGWHVDTLPDTYEYRTFTISYYVNKEPLKFKGGGLLLSNGDHKTMKRIEPNHNRAVIFPSLSTVHSVEYVDLTGHKWEEGRFSIQHWLGFNNKFKFR